MCSYNDYSPIPRLLGPQYLKKNWQPLRVLPYLTSEGKQETFHLGTGKAVSKSQYDKLSEKDKEEHWEEFNDFIFLHGDFSTYARANIYTSDHSVIHSSVSGYPVMMDVQDFCNLHGETKPAAAHEKFYDVIADQFGGFEQNSNMLGSMAIDKNGIIMHDCPTIQGVSGGLLAIAQDKQKEELMQNHAYFSGLHLGGSKEHQMNYAISLTNRTFAIEYLTQMYTHSRDVFYKDYEYLRAVMEFHDVVHMFPARKE